ncbi:SbtR family transcriptional regulator [Streptomyces sp. NBC_01341]|uniref:SbtR family transcriptional regulator n=1 Tax=Streptomyces sp. NBC_01341 TaxID=2903831 RepID=UPI003FA366D2
MEALANEQSGLHDACELTKSAGGRLLERAQETGRIRPDLTIRAAIARSRSASPGQIRTHAISRARWTTCSPPLGTADTNR